MRTSLKLALGASVLGLAAPAGAATFLFNSGNYTPGVTSPDPLLAPDSLEMNTAGNKLFTAVSFTNQSGTVNWNGGGIFLGSGATIFNQSLWNATSDNGLFSNGGALSTFTNSGIFRKSGGVGVTSIGTIAFVNSGTIDAQTGSINFTGGNATFNAGSAFTGAGAVNINSNANFNGGFSSTNLNFNTGVFTGNGAALSGAADVTNGTFAGDWTIGSGATINATTGGNKILTAATMTNNGTVAWQGGSLFLGSGSAFDNNGLFDITATTMGIFNNGGAVSTFTNGATGQFTVNAGSTATVSNRFVNDGGTITSDGTLNFTGGNAVFNAGSVFDGAGDTNINSNAAFNGGFSSTNLNFNAGVFTGNGAALSGAADVTNGTFAGDWIIGSDATLNATTGGNKILTAATMANNGTVAWQGGGLFLGSGSAFDNNGLFDITATTMGIFNNGGAVSTFTNGATGQFTVNAGSTANVSNRFVNDGGTITSDGILNFTGGNAVFNTGSVFNGAGETNINSNASFNGGVSSINLNFNSGTFTGSGAALSGAADWTSGTLTGGWTIGSGATLNAITGGNKIFTAAALTNNGAFAWDDGGLFLGSGSALNNNGTIAITGNNGVFDNGGAASSFVNNGLIEKTAGGSTTTISAGIGFDNNGTMNVTSGTIALPANFTNDGVMAGTGSYSVSGATGLTNNGTIAPGDLGATGTLGLTGNYLQTSSGTFAAQLASSTMFDMFNITGSASLNGTLALSCILSCAINTGDSFVILNSGNTLTGTFANVTTNGFLNGFSYDVIYDYANRQVRLSVLDRGMNPMGGVPEPGTWAMLILGFGLVGNALRRRAAQRTSLVFLR